MSTVRSRGPSGTPNVGENYFRQFIKVNTIKNIEDAQIYLPKANLISSEPWDYDDWYQNDMKKFFENEFDLNGVK